MDTEALLLPDLKSRPRLVGHIRYNILLDAFPRPMLLAIFGLVVLGLCRTSFIVARVIPLLLTAIALFYPARGLLTHLGLLENSALTNVIPGRTSARFPGSRIGEPSPEFCMVLLQTRSNAPFGIFDPNFDYISKSFAGMMKDLQKDPDSGLIGYTPYMNTRRESGNTIGGIYYFTSTEACLKWVKRGLHQSAWMTVARNPERFKDIELSHELFTIKEGGFESAYINCEPIGAGTLYELLPGGGKDGEDIYRNMLQKMGKSSSSKSRMEEGR